MSEDKMRSLMVDLRKYGFPINKQTVDEVASYLKEKDKEPDEVKPEIIAQSILQHTDISADLNNQVELNEYEHIVYQEYF